MYSVQKNRLTCENCIANDKIFQQHQLNSTRFPVFPGANFKFQDISRFPKSWRHRDTHQWRLRSGVYLLNKLVVVTLACKSVLVVGPLLILSSFLSQQLPLLLGRHSDLFHLHLLQLQLVLLYLLLTLDHLCILLHLGQVQRIFRMSYRQRRQPTFYNVSLPLCHYFNTVVSTSAYMHALYKIDLCSKKINF